jgi:hypothetical protein
VTRRIADFYPKFLGYLNVTEVLGRRGQQLLCGEDDLFSWASVRSGLGFGLFPELRITHLILAERLNRQYYKKLLSQPAARSILSFAGWDLFAAISGGSETMGAAQQGANQSGFSGKNGNRLGAAA